MKLPGDGVVEGDAVPAPRSVAALTLRQCHRHWFAAPAPSAGSPPAGVDLPALAARLIAMAARCAGVAGSHPSEAGSPQRVADLLAMAARYVGRSSDSALCNLPQAANLSAAKACLPGAVGAFPA